MEKTVKLEIKRGIEETPTSSNITAENTKQYIHVLIMHILLI